MILSSVGLQESFVIRQTVPVYFVIIYIELHQIDTTPDVFPRPSRLHANN